MRTTREPTPTRTRGTPWRRCSTLSRPRALAGKGLYVDVESHYSVENSVEKYYSVSTGWRWERAWERGAGRPKALGSDAV